MAGELDSDENQTGEQVNAQQIDLLTEVGNDPQFKIKTAAYDPRPQEDKARRYIAYALLAILFFICLCSFIGVVFYENRTESILQLLQIIFTPIVALVSAATGFYYGTKAQG